MTPTQLAARIVTFARAQADQLEGPDRYACFNEVIRLLGAVRDEAVRTPSGFMRAVQLLRNANAEAENVNER